ncbi:MAG TPA: helix-turn-helix domain-containing protein, partial [Actinoplanes sp.]|nr:helix-turn-helix domain-containing protein [Actinoplanes sp.]
MKQTYHHGDLRRALLDAAAEVIEEQGPAALSLRDLARRAGVSHAAPTHHFGDKAGLLTALATEGYGLLVAELAEEWAATHSFLEQGVAYVRFAIRHRAHFEVMFRPDLYH